MSSPASLNPIQLEVLWNRLLSIANEQQTTLIRTAFSTIVRESLDLACGIFDTRGNMIAQSLTGTPGHINPMATGVIHFLKAYPPETLQEGDVLVTNDPWLTTGQINDFTVLTPVFKAGKITGYFANCCHAPDIGGRVLSAEAHEVYEEGLRIPIMKLFDRGNPNEVLFQIIRANVRTPAETVGDLYAQAASNDVGARSLLYMLDEFGLASIDPLADQIIARSESAMRAAIRALPNGCYQHEAWGDGHEDPIKIAVAVTIKDEDITIDFAGSSPQSSRGINVVLNYTHGYASFAMKAAISPDVPHNEGAFRPVHVTAPRGSILNCEEPAAVASRHLVGHLLPSAIFGALAQVIPEQVLAGSADSAWMSVWRARWPESGKQSNITLFQLGGMGARPHKDGLNTTGFPSGVAGVPAEIIETLAPLILQERALRTDSAGVGEFRGGLGQKTNFTYRGTQQWSVSSLVERTNFPAKGLQGGGAGMTGEFKLNGQPAPTKSVLWMDAAAEISLNLPGGGGYGAVAARDPERVLADVVAGYVSIEAAREQYGVHIKYTGEPDALVRLPEHYAIEMPGTPANDTNIILTGFMGTGKTTIGRILAQQLDYDFIDTDVLIEAESGLTISEIFAQFGEAYFRKLEQSTAQKLAQRQRTVIATGGRMMLDPENVATLGSSGTVLCLVASAEEILQRVLGDEKQIERPLLAVADPAQQIRDLLHERREQYGQFPQISTSEQTPDQIMRVILKNLGRG